MSDDDNHLVFVDLARRVREPGFTWRRLRDGVDIHVLYEGKPDEGKPDEGKPDEGKPDEGKPGPPGEVGGASAALLRYAPGGQVPEHVHQGHEHIYVLSGSQQDRRGVYVAGDFVVNRPGSRHTVESPGGCLVLVIWEQRVHFIDE